MAPVPGQTVTPSLRRGGGLALVLLVLVLVLRLVLVLVLVEGHAPPLVAGPWIITIITTWRAARRMWGWTVTRRRALALPA